jgi:cytosine/adenosine deaminase-related metal-dependent hydrolase
MALVIAGNVVPIATSDPTAVFPGRVYLGDDGLIDTVAKTGDPVPSGFTKAPVVDTGSAFVLPGFIDLHNHLGYNTLPLWTEPSRKTPWSDHNQWPAAPSYKPDINWPSSLYANAAPEALLAYVQTRALVGGTTSIQGWPGFNLPVNLILRNIDNEKAGTNNPNLIYTSTLTEKADQLAQTAKHMASGAGFIYHCGEGAPGSAAFQEFQAAATAGCLDSTMFAIHCNSVSEPHWSLWPAATPGAVVWSPFSNLWLYGVTTDVTAAKKLGITICLGPDWGPSGTKHVLGEVKVAKIVSQQQSLGFSDQDLVAMMTSNPGDALARCWKRQVGRLTAGAFGDIAVIRAKGTDPVWTQIINATEADVMLTVVEGQARYGDAAVMKSATTAPTTSITILGSQRSVALVSPTDPTKAFEWGDVTAQLDAVRKDPVTAAKPPQPPPATAHTIHTAAPSLRLQLDMPTGDVEFSPHVLPPDPTKAVIPPIPSLVHDQDFFTAVQKNPFHKGILNGLAAFYTANNSPQTSKPTHPKH